MVTELRQALREAKRDPAVRVIVITGAGPFPMMVMAIVFRSLPRKAAMELMLTGKRFDAAEALRLGLINRHVPADRLDVEIEALTEELAGKSPIAMKLGLEAFYTMQDM